MNSLAFIKMHKPFRKMLAIIITYNPSIDFFSRLTSLFDDFEQIIIVDNASDNKCQERLQELYQAWRERLILVFNQKNNGIAKAINQGIQIAIKNKNKFVIILDQDSTPVSGMVNKLINGCQNHPNKENLAILAPGIEENLQVPFIRKKNFFEFERIFCKETSLQNITFVITSGALYNLDIYQKLGPFREDFFIDYVDMEYCLRAIQHGYEISVQCDARLIHNLGKRQQKKLLGKTLYPTFHSPMRWYYISRNRIAMLKMYALKQPHWFFYEMITTLRTFIRVFSLENQRIKKFRAFLYGTCDGIRGKMGEIPPKVKAKLE